MKQYKSFTPEENQRICDLKARGFTGAEIGRIVGRQRSVIYRQLDRLGETQARQAYTYTCHVEQSVTVPDEVWADRERRMMLAPRDLTASFCGDPMPGMSALDRRRA